MTLYSYRKAPAGNHRFNWPKLPKLKPFPGKRKFFSTVIAVTGLTLILMVLYSSFSYKLINFFRGQSSFISPMVAGASTVKQPESLNQDGTIDYDLINNWFPSAGVLPVKPSKITHYTLSIPKLRIKNAIVEIGGTKVRQNLVQYPGTALPGEFGNTVIFGHSILPIFYNPADYKSIFSLIPTLTKGDKIYLYFDGIEYVYEMFSYVEVKPEEVNVLEQRFDTQTLSLVTCVPPGTYLRRGIIKASLVGN